MVPLRTTDRYWNSRIAKRVARLWLAGLSLVILAVVALRAGTVAAHRGQVYAIASVPPSRTAIVFGAGLTPSGAPTPVLYDRVATAAELYHLGKVEQLLLSGDNRSVDHDEPDAMRRAAAGLGVPDGALLLDDAGLRTYNSCYRAREVFAVERAVLVTQQFHLARALMLCGAVGIDAVGVPANRRDYPMSYVVSWHIRETLATVAAWWDVLVARPKPTTRPATHRPPGPRTRQ